MNHKILLTGASSYVGARLFLDLSKNFEVIGTYYGTKLSDKFIPLDVTNSRAISDTVTKMQPDVIIHAASNASAKWCEDNPEKALILNQESTKSIVQSANTAGSKVILISSFAALNPHNVYAKSKRQSEEYVKDTKGGYIVLRPSLIIGYSPNTVNDRPFNRILKNLDLKTEAAYDTSWKFQPTYVRHISEVIKQVIEDNITNKTIPVAVADLKSRYDIAKDILENFNIKVRPVDKQDTEPTAVENLEVLKELNFPQYSYQEMIKNIVEEIKNRKNFTL